MAELIINPQARDVDWTSKTSYLLFNPGSSVAQVEIFNSVIRRIQDEESYIWLFTSGSESFPKCVGLKKSAILSGAKALASRVLFQTNETWINCLPSFHIGGLAIWARAFVSGQEVVESAWDLERLNKLFSAHAPQWMSLVPTQVYDLIQAGLPAPNSLRGVFVGGGALNLNLDLEAKALGWPVLTTYGMTEASSQVATRTPHGTEFEILDHIEAFTDAEGGLGLRGESVTDKIAFFDANTWELRDPRDKNKIYWTQDKVELNGNFLKPLGRRDDSKKTRGELVSQFSLQTRLEEVLKTLPVALSAVIVFKKDVRLEHKICLVIEGASCKNSVLEQLKRSFNLISAGFEKIEDVYIVSELPRSELGKIRYKKLEELLRSLNPLKLST